MGSMSVCIKSHIALCQCVFCHTSYTGLICDECMHHLHIRNGAMCGVCGVRLTSEHALCVPCRADEVGQNTESIGSVKTDETDAMCIARYYSLFAYNVYARDLIQIYKKQSDIRLGYIIAGFYHRFMLDKGFLSSDTLIIPMPSHKEHIRRVGFDHMKLMGYCLKLFDPHWNVCNGIGRTKSQEQKRLNAEERFLNMKKHLFIRKKAKHSIEDFLSHNANGTIVLFDDVITTGATLSSAGALLRALVPDIPIYALSLIRKEY